MAKKKPPIRTPMLLFGDNPQLIRELGYNADITLGELKEEYTRLRKLGMQRIRRLEKAGYGWTVTAQAYRGDLVKPSTLSSKSAAAWALARVTQLLNAQTTTVSGMKAYERRQVETLNSHGYELTQEQFQDFARFMQWAHELGLVRAYGSGEVAKSFTERSERAKSGANTFNSWKRAVGQRIGGGWSRVMDDLRREQGLK